jgi:hypothetical protein
MVEISPTFASGSNAFMSFCSKAAFFSIASPHQGTIVNFEFLILDDFVKSPSAALRFIFSHCGVLVSTPHS